ncbi:MAG: serine hydrolase domain-containing protein [Rhizomicrobium sp.]
MDLAPSEAGFDPARLARITGHLERHYIEPEKIAGCQVAVVRKGHVAYWKSFGRMDRERDKPMRDDAIFRIYSMTKPITSVALMTLYEQGAFQLDDPVSRFVPSWRGQQVYESGDCGAMKTRAPKRPASMRDMLCHTGGLTYGNMLAALGAPNSAHPVDQAYAAQKIRRDPKETLSDFLEKLAEIPLFYEPGERWMYSLSTDVCGALVERISGMRFDKFLEATIFGPLGMKDTAFFVPPDKLSRFCANYRRRIADKTLQLIDDPETSLYREEPSFFSGGGGLTSTLSDYLRFAEMLRRGGELDGARIIGPRTLELMHQNHLKDGRDLAAMALSALSETANEGVGFGLGFASTIDQVKAGTLGVGDYYWGGAASTIFWVDPKEDMSVVFMTQFMPSATFGFRAQLKNIIYSAIID